jgi:membrane fusion protein
MNTHREPEDVLFRAEALRAARSRTFGEIILIRPLSSTVLTTLAVSLATAICAFLIFGTYTRRSAVVGQLVSDAGLVKMYAPQPGIVLERHVVEGQQIGIEDVLFVISSERSSQSQGDTQAMISSRVQERQASLESEMQKTRILQENEQQEIQRKLDAMQAEGAKLRAQIQNQRELVELAQQTEARYQDLKARDLISGEQLQQKTADLLGQRTRLQSMERDQIALERDRVAQQAQLADLSLKQQNELAQISRSLASTSEELAESEVKRRLVISAPESGTATAVLANVGQAVDAARPLVSIVPAGASLHAELYAPSRAIGFIRPGDSVLIRYQAFAYQKFGHQKGVVESVARTALPNSELTEWAASTNAGGSEPLYRITVRLFAQSVRAYGVAQPLQSGMLLDADVLQERRRLYEWVLEPLYSLSGKL